MDKLICTLIITLITNVSGAHKYSFIYGLLLMYSPMVTNICFVSLEIPKFLGQNFVSLFYMYM